MKKSDTIVINAVVYLIAVLISYVTVRNLAAAIFIGFLLWVTFNRVTIHILNRRKDKNKITVAQMEDRLALYGIGGQVEFFVKATPPCFTPVPFDCGFEATINCEKVIIFPNYKFSPCSMEEIAKFYRLAKEKNSKRIWILSRLNPRSLVLFARTLDVEFEFKNSKTVRKFLYNRNMLMEKIPKKPVKRNKINWKELISGIFIKRRAKYFLFVGLSLAFLSIFSPLKIYYAVMSIFALGMGVACLFRENA